MILYAAVAIVSLYMGMEYSPAAGAFCLLSLSMQAHCLIMQQWSLHK